MPDEITPEQWRAWREDPCTKRLVAKMEDWEKTFGAWAERHRQDAIEAMDRGSDVAEIQRVYRSYRTQAGTTRIWIDAVSMQAELVPPAPKQPEAPAVPPLDGRRVTVKG